MRTHRAITIAVFVLLQATANAQTTRVIIVDPQPNLFAAPGDYVQWKKATPQVPDFVVVFQPGQSPCQETTIPVNGSNPGSCQVIVPASGDFGYYPYDIYLNLPGSNVVPLIQKPKTWPQRIPFQVSKCGICGSAVVTQGTKRAGATPHTSSTTVAAAKPRLQTTDSDTGYISCDSANHNITKVTDLNVLLSDQQITWIQAGVNSWKIDTFKPSLPCTQDTITSAFRVCFLSSSASGNYTYSVTAKACSGSGTGKLSIK